VRVANRCARFQSCLDSLSRYSLRERWGT
jgi:hypothetical protein